MEIDFFVSESAYNKILSLIQTKKFKSEFSSITRAGSESEMTGYVPKSKGDCKSAACTESEQFDGYIIGDGSVYGDAQSDRDGHSENGELSNRDSSVLSQKDEFDGKYDFLLSNGECNSEPSKSTMMQNEKLAESASLEQSTRAKSAKQSAKSVEPEKSATLEHSANSKDSASSKPSENGSSYINNTFFKISVIGGGCAGFSYDFSIVNQKNENDVEIPIATEESEINLLIDGMSVHLLSGCYLDYEVSLVGSKFKLENPNACANCSCGSSFGI